MDDADNEETTNFVLIYARNGTDKAFNLAVANEVSEDLKDKRGPGATVKTGQELMKELFPVVEAPDTPPVQRQAYVETETLCCSKERHNLANETVYKPIRDASYFYKGKRWDTLSCRHCKQTFVGDKKPTDRNPVYVCNEYELRKTDCKQDGAVCYACYTTQQVASPKRSRHRTRLT